MDAICKCPVFLLSPQSPCGCIPVLLKFTSTARSCFGVGLTRSLVSSIYEMVGQSPNKITTQGFEKE